MLPPKAAQSASALSLMVTLLRSQGISSLVSPAKCPSTIRSYFQFRRMLVGCHTLRRTTCRSHGIQLSEAVTGDGVAIFRHACWMDLGGIVSKRIGSRYVSGRTRAWLKTKNRDFRRSQLRRPGRLRRQSPEFTYSGIPLTHV